MSSQGTCTSATVWTSARRTRRYWTPIEPAECPNIAAHDLTNPESIEHKLEVRCVQRVKELAVLVCQWCRVEERPIGEPARNIEARAITDEDRRAVSVGDPFPVSECFVHDISISRSRPTPGYGCGSRCVGHRPIMPG